MLLGAAPLTSCVLAINWLNIFSAVVLHPEVAKEIHSLKIDLVVICEDWYGEKLELFFPVLKQINIFHIYSYIGL